MVVGLWEVVWCSCDVFDMILLDLCRLEVVGVILYVCMLEV